MASPFGIIRGASAGIHSSREGVRPGDWAGPGVFSVSQGGGASWWASSPAADVSGHPWLPSRGSVCDSPWELLVGMARKAGIAEKPATIKHPGGAAHRAVNTILKCDSPSAGTLTA